MRNKITLVLAMLTVIGCQTIEFGTEETVESITETIKSDSVNQYNISYRSYLGRSLLSSGKSVPEDIFFAPDGVTTFVIVSFPKIGILKTTDNGETFTHTFFDLPSLNTHFGYKNEADRSARENADSDKKEKIPDFNRIIPQFEYGTKDPNKILIVMGDYAFTSTNNGDSWKHKKIFFDNSDTKILNATITNNDEIILFAGNKIAISSDWGKKWQSKFLKLPGKNIFNMQFVDAICDKHNTVYLCCVNKNTSDGEYSAMSYDFFYNRHWDEKQKCCVYYSTDNCTTWTPTEICVPAAFFNDNNDIYITSVYPCDLYRYEFSKEFRSDKLYKQAKLTQIKKIYAEYLDYLGNTNPDNLSILSPTNNAVAKINLNKYEFLDNPPFEIIYSGMRKLQNLYYTQFEYKYFDIPTGNNFNYEFSQFRIFKKWTAMKTNNPILYAKDGETYYRMIIEPNFWTVFGKYAFENKQKLNNVNPFLRKLSDVEFINPETEKSGFPVILQKSADGQNWTKIGDNAHICTVIDPLSNKRSGLYWYKNVEQKKNFKLQFSFGSDKGINYMEYPVKLEVRDGLIYILLSYFTFTNNYKDLYTIKP